MVLKDELSLEISDKLAFALIIEATITQLVTLNKSISLSIIK